MEELPEIERYQLRQEAAPKVRKNREVFGNAATPYYQDAFEELGNGANSGEVLDYLLKFVGVSGTPFKGKVWLEGRWCPVVQLANGTESTLTKKKAESVVGRFRKQSLPEKTPLAVSP